MKNITLNGKQFTVTHEMLISVAGISARDSKFAFVLFCYITNHLMTGPLGKSEFCFPRVSMFSSTSSRETLGFSGNKIHCSPRDQSLVFIIEFIIKQLDVLKRLVAEFLQPSSILLLKQTVIFGEAHSCAGKRKVFSSELMLLLLKIINLKGSCFWLRENIEFYNENSNFGKTHFSLERVEDLAEIELQLQNADYNEDQFNLIAPNTKY